MGLGNFLAQSDNLDKLSKFQADYANERFPERPEDYFDLDLLDMVAPSTTHEELLEGYIASFKGYDPGEDSSTTVDPGRRWSFTDDMVFIRFAGQSPAFVLFAGDCSVRWLCNTCRDFLCVGCGDTCLIDLDAGTVTCNKCLDNGKEVGDILADRLNGHN